MQPFSVESEDLTGNTVCGGHHFAPRFSGQMNGRAKRPSLKFQIQFVVFLIQILPQVVLDRDLLFIL